MRMGRDVRFSNVKMREAPHYVVVHLFGVLLGGAFWCCDMHSGYRVAYYKRRHLNGCGSIMGSAVRSMSDYRLSGALCHTICDISH